VRSRIHTSHGLPPLIPQPLHSAPRSQMLTSADVHFPHTILPSLRICLASPRPAQGRRLLVAHPRLQSQTAITFSNLLIRVVRRRLGKKRGLKNILRPSNVPSARRNSLAPTTFDRICARTQTSVLSSALSAGKPSLGSMTVRGTKDCIVERRNSCAEVI